jgi:NifU-like protein involved in Fe-S cluster formation
MYSARLLDHFHNPRHVGEVDPPHGTGEASNDACGDRLRLTIGVEGEALVQVRFRAVGCAATIAAGSAIAEWATGRSLEDALGATPQFVERDLLGGLPRGKQHAASMAVDGLRRAIAEHRGRKDRARD